MKRQAFGMATMGFTGVTVIVAGGNSKARPGLGDYSWKTGTAEIYHQQN